MIATIMIMTMTIMRRIWAKMKFTMQFTRVEILDKFFQFARYPVCQTININHLCN